MLLADLLAVQYHRRVDVEAGGKRHACAPSSGKVKASVGDETRSFTYAKGHNVLADPLERHHKRVCGQWREILVVLKRKRRVSNADTESVQDDITSENSGASERAKMLQRADIKPNQNR